MIPHTDTVRAAVYEIVNNLSKGRNPVETSLLKEDLGLDSMQLVRIITRLTLKLKVNIFEFSDQDLAGVKTIGDLIRLFVVKQTSNEIS